MKCCSLLLGENGRPSTWYENMPGDKQKNDWCKHNTKLLREHRLVYVAKIGENTKKL